MQEALVSLLNLLDHGNEHIWQSIPNDFSKKLIEKTWSLVHKRNKKFLVNALRVLGHFLCKLNDDCLTEAIEQDSKNYEFLNKNGSEKEDDVVEILFQDLMNLLQHKYPKYGWNVAYILENLVHKTGKSDENSVREQLKKKLFLDAQVVIKLFLDTQNLKMKLSMSALLIEPKIYSEFQLSQAVRLFTFLHQLKTGEWE